MRTPLGGNKRSHAITQRINARMRAARLRRNPDGKFESAADMVRRDMIEMGNVQILIKLPFSKPDATVEGCAVEG